MRTSLLKYLASILASALLAASAFAGIGAPPYNPKNVGITGGTITGITNDAGLVFNFAGSTCPSGSIIVPTAAGNISRTTYAALFAAIGTTWGAGDGSTTFGRPWLAANYAAVQANSNVGSASVGVMPAHTHTIGTNYSGSSTAALGNTRPAANDFNNTTGSTGTGTANLAAGTRFLMCVKI
jgi:hypothetical protein